MKSIKELFSKFCLKHYRCYHFINDVRGYQYIPDCLRDFYSTQTFCTGDVLIGGSVRFVIKQMFYDVDNDVTFCSVDMLNCNEHENYFFCSICYLWDLFSKYNKPTHPDDSYDLWKEIYKELKERNLLYIDNYDEVLFVLKDLLKQ